jgi:hypothetical protein
MKLPCDDGTNQAHPPPLKKSDMMRGLFLLLLQVVFHRCKVQHLCVLAVKSGQDLQLRQFTDGGKRLNNALTL